MRIGEWALCVCLTNETKHTIRYIYRAQVLVDGCPQIKANAVEDISLLSIQNSVQLYVVDCKTRSFFS